jgi:hypothetical protein
MLRLVLLALYLAASFASSPPAQQQSFHHLKTPAQAPPATPTADIGGGLDPDGLRATTPTATADIGGGLDPNG